MVIGCGDMGRAHVQAWQERADARVVAVCDANPSAAQTLAEAHGLIAYDDCAMALKRSGADIVSVCVPVNLHRAVAEAAFRAGCHVLMEKPIAGAMEDAHAIRQAALASGRKLVVSYQYRGFFGYARLKEWLAQEPVPGPLFMRCFDVREVRPKLAMHRRSANGGPIVDMCGHLFDMARHLFGTEPQSVYARGHVAGAGRLRLAEVEDPAIDAAEILVDFVGGHTLSVFVNWGMPETFPTMASVELIGPRFHAAVETNRLRLTTTEGASEWSAASDTAGPASRMQDLIQSIESGAEPELSAGEAIRALAVSLAALRSIETGQPAAIHTEA